VDDIVIDGAEIVVVAEVWIEELKIKKFFQNFKAFAQ
jgi:hypothetical protein